MLKNTLLTLFGLIGVYCICVATFIINLEVTCGIENMPMCVGVRLAIMYLFGFVAIRIGTKFWKA